MTPEPRYCKDCRYFRSPKFFTNAMVEFPTFIHMTAGCAHPAVAEQLTTSLVTGERTQRACYIVRQYGHVCGPAGQLWEPSP